MRRARRLVSLFALAVLAGTVEAGVSIRIEGVSWWKARELRETVRLLEPEDGFGATVDAAFMEDAVVLLQAALEREGFLASSGSVVAERGDEALGDFPWRTGGLPRPPRDLAADRVRFRLEPGVRYFLAALDFEGLRAVEERVARSYFLEEGLLLPSRSGRAFVPGAFARGLDNLREQLVRLGHADARVEADPPARDPATGAVEATVRVREGPRHRIGGVRVPDSLPAGVDEEIRRIGEAARGAWYSPLWRQDFVQAVRGALYARGYARPEVGLELIEAEERGGVVERTHALSIDPGTRVTIGTVEFTGERLPRESVLRRAIGAREGEVFDRTEVERDRLRLGALGVFSAVRAGVEEASPELWNLTYALERSKQIELSLLAGYGSYELLRGGLEVTHANLLERAHRGRLQVVQSVRASSGEYNYTIPQVFGTSADFSARGFGLLREEVSFDREEAGVSLGVRKASALFGFDAALRYQFESVGVDDVRGDFSSISVRTSRVAALTLDLTRDRRDNPIAPRRGNYLAASLETAARAIGGEVDYQRLELRAAWHRTHGGGRVVHAGVRHGVLWDLGSGLEMPLARRFFPGGENSVRGFREGRASPRGLDRVIVGAETSTILNLELVQALAGRYSLVAFVDAGLTGEKLRSYPGDQWRVSAGIGLRLDTPIGPARIEYGHNVVKQTGDAAGELHFALGFPF